MLNFKYVFPSFVCLPLEAAGFPNAFSTRNGGTSPFPQDSLNLDFKMDSRENVLENRRRFLKSLGEKAWPLFNARQVHSNAVYVVRGVETEFDEAVEADALVTQKPEIFLAVRTADCLPILVADPAEKVVAAIHAGWRSTVQRIVENTFNVLKNQFGVRPETCLAALGPCACGECYEVRRDVIQEVEGEFGEGQFLRWEEPGVSARLDLKSANRHQLIRAGVNPEKIMTSPFCTIHQNERFFSNRIEGQANPLQVGRMMAAIGINI